VSLLVTGNTICIASSQSSEVQTVKLLQQSLEVWLALYLQIRSQGSKIFFRVVLLIRLLYKLTTLPPSSQKKRETNAIYNALLALNNSYLYFLGVIVSEYC